MDDEIATAIIWNGKLYPVLNEDVMAMKEHQIVPILKKYFNYMNNERSQISRDLAGAIYAYRLWTHSYPCIKDIPNLDYEFRENENEPLKGYEKYEFLLGYIMSFIDLIDRKAMCCYRCKSEMCYLFAFSEIPLSLIEDWVKSTM